MHLELSPHVPWEADASRIKGLLVAINIPGYYSLPVRILSLGAMSDATLSQRIDIRFIEWDNPQYLVGRTTVGIPDVIETISAFAPDILGLSMNIWNRNACIEVARQIKIDHPGTCILVGGQEVTNSVVDYLQLVPEFDYLIDGEGELPFIDFLTAFNPQAKHLEHPGGVAGLRYRRNGNTEYTGPGRCLSNLNESQSIILADLVPANEKNKLGVLLESSRGCPNRCGFCFEGAKREKIRLASTDRLGEEAAHMAAKGARYFHVMDPILCNSKASRLSRLSGHFKRIKAQYGRLSISVETYADQITDAVAEHLGEFSMLDIGLQSTHPPTLAAIHRKFNMQRFTTGIERIRKYGSTINIYLILGLPYETAASFFDGLFFAMRCRPTQIFINELLLLNGTDLRRRAVEFGYVFDPQPPYTVFETNRISKSELKYLKIIAKNIEHRYNLNNCILSAPTPFRPAMNAFDQDYLKIVLGGPCQQACTGCRLAGNALTAVDKTPLPDFLDQQANANIELVCGDGISIATIVHAAAQARLAGALRVKLTAPFSLFAKPQSAHQLVNAGIYFFKTYFKAGDPAEKKKFETSMQDFRLACKRGMQSTGHHIFPHIEIVMLGDNMDDTLLVETATALGTHYASMVEMGDVSLDPIENGRRSLEDLLGPAIDAGLQHRFMVKLSSSATAALFVDNDEKKAIIAALNQLGLISRTTGRPCLVPCD